MIALAAAALSCRVEAVAGGPPDLLITEIVARNEGVWVDEVGETDDFVELTNVGATSLQLADFSLSDRYDRGHRLPRLSLPPGGTVVLWADDQAEQGLGHLPFALDGDGEMLFLRGPRGLVDRVEFPALADNTSFARVTAAPAQPPNFVSCRYPTPGRANGTCQPPPPGELPDNVQFARFNWPAQWPPVAGPLRLSELALRPASFIEIENSSTAAVPLADYQMRISPHRPGMSWPDMAAGIELVPSPETPALLPPGGRAVFPVSEAQLAVLSVDPAFEGVVTVFFKSGVAVDRIDFMWWPMGAVLTRPLDGNGPPRFCHLTSPGQANAVCDPLPSRPVGDRVRHVYTPGDLAALAADGTALSTVPVKFVVDLAHGNVVHLLSSQWPLHYTFIREQIDGEPHLDVCEPEQSALFRAAWAAFSQREYYVTEGRHYLLGTLVHHTSASLHSVEFAVGDTITGAQMRHAFFTVMANVDRPQDYHVRPQTPKQLNEVRAMEGQLPAVGPNAPYRGLQFQPLTTAIGYGLLRFIPASELPGTPLDPRTILLTDDVPNDIPLVGGLITEAFQAPLAHVNVLSRGRGTPNMALRGARSDARILPWLGKLVRIEVRPDGFTVREASAEEVAAHWQDRFGSGPPLSPRLDVTERRLQPLSALDLTALPRYGGKAAQLAELERVRAGGETCPGPLTTPAKAFALPVVHSMEHLQRSGGAALLAALLADAAMRADLARRNAQLAAIREAVLRHPVDGALLGNLEKAIKDRFGNGRVRLRSSSNAEDLSDFSGAGLYTSTSAAIGDRERSVANGVRTVWASLWDERAFAEREMANVDHTRVGMGVLVHEAFLSERANGVAVSRNVLDPSDGDIYYINVQLGEASVTNPAPGIGTEQLLYRLYRQPHVVVQSRSTFSPAKSVLTDAEVERLACQMQAAHDHFRARLDPDHQRAWFALDFEFKVVLNHEGVRTLLVKQARPYSFGHAEIPTDCRETL